MPPTEGENNNEPVHAVWNLDQTQAVPEDEHKETVHDSLENDTWRDQK